MSRLLRARDRPSSVSAAQEPAAWRGYGTNTKESGEIVFQTATPLIGPGYSSVSCPEKGASFTLKASLSPEVCWYITSSAGGAVVPSAGTGTAIFVGGTVAEEVRLKTVLKA